jgi:zinc protease
VQRGGVGEWDAPTLGRILAGKSPEVRLGQELTATSLTEDLELTLQLVHLYLTSPRRDPAAFESLLKELQLPASRQPFESALLGDQSALESTTGASLDGAFRVHAQRYANAARLQVVLVADVEQGRLRWLVERYFASLPGTDSGQATALASSKMARESDGRASRLPKRRVQLVHVSGRPSRETQVVLRFAGVATPSAEARVEFYALQTHLRRRLRERLREELGGVYDVDVAGGWAGAGFWQEIRFECKPEQAQQLRDAARDLIAELSQKGLSDAELRSLVAGYTGTFPGALRSDDFWYTELVHAVREGADPRRILELPALVSRITAPNLRQAAQRYLPLDNYVDAVWSAQ